MLSGYFKNCYGLEDFVLPLVELTPTSNVAVVYAPNGVMKTSFAQVFSDVVSGSVPKDRLFTELASEYQIDYCGNVFDQNTSRETDLFYVIKSFDEKFTASNDSISFLLADEATKLEYDRIIAELNGLVSLIRQRLNIVSGIAKPQVKKYLAQDLLISEDLEWVDILIRANDYLGTDYTSYDLFSEVKYSEIFNDKTARVFDTPNFCNELERYIESLNNVLASSDLFRGVFTDYNAADLTKSLSKNNLFEAEHSIVLESGTQIDSFNDWKRYVDEQTNQIYADPEVTTHFQSLQGLFGANQETQHLRAVLVNHRELIPLLADIPKLKKDAWIYYLTHMETTFSETLEAFAAHKTELARLYDVAGQQRPRWEKVVQEFNQRFSVPFEMSIENQPHIVLQSAPAKLELKYYRHKGTPQEQMAVRDKDQLMQIVSMGEKRALYLLNVLFDVEQICERSEQDGIRRLLIFDDVADSFDYKNKSAIIEYLYDIAHCPNIDVLVLTHNYDFYRTTHSRLNIDREKCYIVQKSDSFMSIQKFPYLGNYFNNVLLRNIRNGTINTEDKEKAFIASIPFFRNLAEYSEADTDNAASIYMCLTCVMHVKRTPHAYNTITPNQVWDTIYRKFELDHPLNYADATTPCVTIIKRVADVIEAEAIESIRIDNKIILSMAIRLVAEEFLHSLFQTNHVPIAYDSGNQTGKWIGLAKDNELLSAEQKSTLNRVCLSTPEVLHLNAFMYEPIIDLSDWSLKQLYSDVKVLTV